MRMLCGPSCTLKKCPTPQPLCHAEVQEAADMVAPQFKKLVAATIQGIAKTL